MAPAETGHFGSAQVSIGNIGNIDIQQYRLTDRITDKTLDKLTRNASGRIEILAFKTGQ